MAIRESINAIAAFGAWWRAEILACVPARVRVFFASRGVRRIVEISGNEAHLYDERRGERTLKLKAALPEGLERIADAIPRARGRVVLRLPRDRVLLRDLKFPGRARRDLGRILRLDLERSTPFRLEDVAFDFKVGAVDRQTDEIKVRQVIVKRDVMDAALADCRGAGVPVDGVDAQGGEGVNLASGLRSMFSWKLSLTSAGIAALALAAIVATAQRQERTLADLHARASALEADTGMMRSAALDARARVQQVSALRTAKIATPSALVVLNELSGILPDTIWLTDFRLTGRTVDIGGYAASASSVISLIEASPMFEDTTMTAPITVDQGVDGEHFSVEFKASPAAAIDAPATSPDAPA